VNRLEILELLNSIFLANSIDVVGSNHGYYPDKCIDYSSVMHEIEKLIKKEIKDQK